MTFLKKFDAFLNKLEGAVLVLFLSAMVILAFAQVILRNGFNSTILWVDILLRHLVLWIGFLGAALATSNERHINIDAFTRFLPQRLRSLLSVLTNIFALFLCYLLFRASLTFLTNEIADKATIYADIPSWSSEVIIPTGFGLLIFHFLVRAFVAAHLAWNGEEKA